MNALSGALSGARAALTSPNGRRIIYGLAVTLLIVGLVIALNALPADIALKQWRYVMLIFVLIAPLGVITNTLETELTARLLNVRFGWRRAFKLSVLASAANVLPLPGGPLVRTVALKDLGVDLKLASSIVIAVAVQWVGVILIVAGVCFTILNIIQTGITSIFLGGGALLFSLFWMRAIGSSFKNIALIMSARLFTSAVGVVGIWWSFAALGETLTLIEASIFSLASASGVAVSFVPAGLGVTEAAAAALAVIISLSPALAFVAATLYRIIWLAFLLPVAAIISLTSTTSGYLKNRPT
ncbi:MAG: hypothetical protein DHS20C05_17410 [Hyphococcus sp.]|nr:MAG: hypothetical protein DHS20C05_17410 [Marinicaulis sp.]